MKKKRCFQAYNVKENSRLGCQIHITEDLEGLEVELALRVNVLLKKKKKGCFNF